MKKWIIGLVCVSVLSLIVFGKINWDQKVEETAGEVEAALEQKQETEVNEDASGSKADDEAKEDGEMSTDVTNDRSGESLTDSKEPGTKTEPASSKQTSSESTNGSETSTKTNDNSTTNGSEESVDREVDNEVEKLSLGQIKDKYFLEFRELERVQNKKLDELLIEAIEEYEYYTLNKISYSRDEFIDKYQTKAATLEVEADVAFFQVYESMKKELRQNGFSEEEAKPNLSIYEDSKERRRSGFLNLLK